uniref:Uncharacterized protein n=1 Tax=Arion vulgaris TaxID=1028688 RepID=A0A0B6ZDS6_9EUPU
MRYNVEYSVRLLFFSDNVYTMGDVHTMDVHTMANVITSKCFSGIQFGLGQP